MIFAAPITLPAYTLLEIDFPSGTRGYSLSAEGVFSPSGGLTYSPRMISCGSVRFALSDDIKAMQHPQLQPTLADADDSLLNLIGKGERWQYSAARAYFAPATASGRSQWTKFFGGVLDDLQPSARGEFQLSLTPNVKKLKSPFPLTQVNQYDWPKADKTALGGQVPIVLGKHDDYGDQNTGAVPTLYVDKDSANYYYLVSIGWVNVLRVYSGGSLKTLGSQYTIKHLTVGGRLYTVIHFLADQTTNQVTCDVEGYDTVGNGTGTLIFEATDVLKHVLVQFVFNEYQGGNWISGLGGAPINTTTLATVRAQLAGRAGGAAFAASRYLAGQTTGEQFINEWSQSTGVDVVWDQDGNLAFYYDDPYASDPGYSAPAFYFPADFSVDGRSLGVTAAGNVATGIIQYEQFQSEPSTVAAQGIHAKLKKHKPDPNAGGGQGYYQLQVTDPLATVLAAANLNAGCGPAVTP